jgi:hypothetical protein
MAKLGDGVADLVARMLAMAVLWVRIQTYLKAKDISKGVANTL